MRYEWHGRNGSRFYAEKGSDGIFDTNAGPDDFEAHEEMLRLAERVKELEARPLKSFNELAADRMADEVAVLVARGLLDSRSAVADALLDYREPPRTPRSDRIAALEEENARLTRHAEILEAENRQLRMGLEAVREALNVVRRAHG